MKRFLLLIVSLAMLLSCQEKDERVDVFSKLIGTWVYDSSQDQITEVITFKESGVFYLSYNVSALGQEISIDNALGRYSLSESNITGSYDVNGTPMYVDFTILDINSCELYTRFNNSGGTIGFYTYQRLVGNVELELLNSSIPDYSSMTKKKILSYRSHDSRIAEVDKMTGEIKATGVGRTYVDLITDEGSMVFEVNVTTDYVDYSPYLGKTRREIYKEFGENFSNSSDTKVAYDLQDGENLIFVFDEKPCVVGNIGIDFSKTSKYNEDVMFSYLDGIYFYSEAMSTDKYETFVDSESISECELVVNINKGQNQVVYSAKYPIFKDHTIALGSTISEIYELYGDLNDENIILLENETIGYVLPEKNLLGVVMSFYKNKVWEMYLFPENHLSKTQVHDYFCKKYIYNEASSNADNYCYFSEDASIGVWYSLTDNFINFYLVDVLEDLLPQGTRSKSTEGPSDLREDMEYLKEKLMF